MNNKIFCIEDISTDEVVLAGKYHPATRLDPEEYDEIYSTNADCLDVKTVLMVTDKEGCNYVTDEDTKVSVYVEATDSFQDFNIFDIAKRLAAGGVTTDEVNAVFNWLEDQRFSCEEDLLEMIAEKGQENLGSDDSYDDDPPDYDWDVCPDFYDGH